MSVYVSAYVWRHSASKGGTRLVLLALADIADDDGNIPPHRDASMAKLAAKTLLDVRQVRRCIRDLERIKELATVPGRGQTPSRYKVLMRQLAMFDQGGFDVVADAKAVDKSQEPEPGKNRATGHEDPVREDISGTQSGRRRPVNTRIDVVDVTPSRGVLEKPVDNYTIPASVIAWAAEQVPPLTPHLHLHLEVFRNKLANGLAARRKYKDLDAAFRNCVLADWEGVRKNAQIAAKHDRGPDLDRWWTTHAGRCAKGLAVGLKWEDYKATHNGHGNSIGYHIALVDRVIDVEGFGPWYDERDSTVHGAVKKLRAERGAAA